MDVNSCNRVDIDAVLQKNPEKAKYLNDLDANSKRQFFSHYRGYIMTGKIVRSKAKRVGLSEQSGALIGETVSVYIKEQAGNCNGVVNKRVGGYLEEICCTGGADAPCMLTTNYLFSKFQILGDANSRAGDKERKTAVRSQEYLDGLKSFEEKKYKIACKKLETVRSKNQLDLYGHYILGEGYRRRDMCAKALEPLKYVYDRSVKGHFWADEEATIRKSNFLLARCYSKLNKPGEATLILNGYLLEPKKYQSEIADSLRHKDFGWIHTSKEYRSYKEAAEKKVK